MSRKNLDTLQIKNVESTESKGPLLENIKDIKDLIAPSGIDASSTNHLEIFSNTNKYARTMIISVLPRMCTFPEFLRSMYTFGDINVSVFINPISEAKSQNELNKVINTLESERIVAKDRGNINREIKHQNMILREISRRIKALLNWIRGIGKEEKAETDKLKSKENLLSVFENLIRKNADNHNADLEQYIGSYQFLKEKNIISVSELKENIVTLRDKNYKTTRAIKDTEKKIDDRVQLIDQTEKYLKYKDTYKAYIKLKKNKQDTFYNEHTAEIILFESAKKYLKEHLGESKTLNISKWKSEVANMKKEKNSLYNQAKKWYNIRQVFDFGGA